MLDEWFQLWRRLMFWWLPDVTRDPPDNAEPSDQRQNVQKIAPERSTNPRATDPEPSAPEPSAPEPSAPETSAPESPAAEPGGSVEPAQAASTAKTAAPAEAAAPADDLTAIKGVGSATAALLEQHGIRSFHDLAQADAETVAHQIDRPTVKAKTVARWIEDARKRSGN